MMNQGLGTRDKGLGLVAVATFLIAVPAQGQATTGTPRAAGPLVERLRALSLEAVVLLRVPRHRRADYSSRA